MAVDFVKIHNKLSRAVAKNFPLRIETDVVVENINLEQHYFTIKTTAGLIDCHTSQTDLSNIKNGTNIHIEGYLKIHTTTISKIYLELENYFILGEKERLMGMYKRFQKIQNELSKDKYQHIITSFSLQKPPNIIYNVVLIVPPGNQIALEKFKTIFQNKCQGQLFIYHLMENDYLLQYPMEYFKKYRNIHLVCLLVDNSSFDCIGHLSSVENLKYLLKRKGTPYLVSIVSDIPSKTKPLSCILANKRLSSVESCIDFIVSVQSETKKILSETVNMGKNILNAIIYKHKDKLYKLKLCIMEYRYEPPHMQKLCNILEKYMMQKKISLQQIQNSLMKQIIDDPRTQKATSLVMEAERRKNEQDQEKKIENLTLTI